MVDDDDDDDDDNDDDDEHLTGLDQKMISTFALP